MDYNKKAICPKCGFYSEPHECKCHTDQVILGDACDEARETIRGARQDSYGHPEDSFQKIASYWSMYLNHPISPLDVAHMMTLFKMARMCGQKPNRDNYVDAIGYLSIAADRILHECGKDCDQDEECLRNISGII